MRSLLTLLTAAVITLSQGLGIYAVAVGGQGDETPPTLTGLQLDQTVVDVAQSSATVGVALSVDDDIAGFERAVLTISSPSGIQSQSLNIYYSDLAAGDELSGTYQNSILLPAYSEAGEWTISSILLSDSVDNWSSYVQQEIAAIGDSTITVTGGPDLAPPLLNDLTVVQQPIDLSGGSAQLSMNLSISDNISGVQRGVVTVKSPNALQVHSLNFYASNIVSGDQLDGVYSVSITLPQYAEAGEWTIESVQLRDNTGNWSNLNNSQLVNNGLASTFAVISEPQDISAPQINGLSINPAQINISNSAQPLSIELHLTDDLSGFYRGVVTMTSPSGSQIRSSSFYGSALTTGDHNDGYYTTSITIPQYSETGEWTISSVQLRDVVGNWMTFSGNELMTSGFDPTLSVTTNEPPVADIGGPYTAAEGTPLLFSAENSADPDGAIANYQWDLDGDGLYDDAVGATTLYSFVNDGDFPISVAVTDSSGVIDYDSTIVTVQNAAPVVTEIAGSEEPILIGTASTVDLFFSDPGVNDLLTLTLEWGDGTTSVVSDPTVNGDSYTHTYTEPGVYEINAIIEDDGGLYSSQQYRYVVVYDPTGGFVTGGGWIIPSGASSDPGDMLPSLDGSSHANFGFVVKYKNGSATVPGGNLEFHYNVGNFHLVSAEFDWLVVTNPQQAKFMGYANIDGLAGDFPFKVSAVDSTNDRFTIKIWDVGADPDTDDVLYKASGDLEGGQIKIHKK